MFHFSFSIITLIVMFADRGVPLYPFVCKRTGDITCTESFQCCSTYCYKEDTWKHGQCREYGKPVKTDQINECSSDNFMNRGNKSVENGMYAIHKTLPINTLVRVFLKNGRNVVVTIIEHGPFGQKKVLQLSKGAADSLGISQEHSVPCEVTLLNQKNCLPALSRCFSYEECCSQRCEKRYKGYGYPRVCIGYGNDMW